MDQFQRLNPATMSPHDLQRWLALTPSAYHDYFFKEQARYKIAGAVFIIVGALQNNTPIGVALATRFPHNKVADIEYMFVSPAYRHHQIGAQLFLFLEQELIKESCIGMTMVYPENEPTTPILEKLMRNSGWDKPRLFMIRCQFKVADFNPLWYVNLLEKKNQWVNESEVCIFPWRELKLQERNLLYHQQEQGRIPLEISPFKEPEKIEYLNSLGLRYKEEVIGWIVTHRIEPEMIRYSSLYIHKEYQFLGYSMHLLCQAICLHKQSGVPFGMLEINVRQAAPSWMSFVKRRLIPYAASVVKFRQSWRILA